MESYDENGELNKFLESQIDNLSVFRNSAECYTRVLTLQFLRVGELAAKVTLQVLRLGVLAAKVTLQFLRLGELAAKVTLQFLRLGELAAKVTL